MMPSSPWKAHGTRDPPAFQLYKIPSTLRLSNSLLEETYWAIRTITFGRRSSRHHKLPKVPVISLLQTDHKMAKGTSLQRTAPQVERSHPSCLNKPIKRIVHQRIVYL